MYAREILLCISLAIKWCPVPFLFLLLSSSSPQLLTRDVKVNVLRISRKKCHWPVYTLAPVDYHKRIQIVFHFEKKKKNTSQRETHLSDPWTPISAEHTSLTAPYTHFYYSTSPRLSPSLSRCPLPPRTLPWPFPSLSYPNWIYRYEKKLIVKRVNTPWCAYIENTPNWNLKKNYFRKGRHFKKKKKESHVTTKRVRDVPSTMWRFHGNRTDAVLAL